MPEKISIIVVEDGNLDYNDLLPLIRTACTNKNLTDGIDYEIERAENKAQAERLFVALESAGHQRVIAIFDVVIEKGENDMLDTYIATSMRGTSNPGRYHWPIIVYSRFPELAPRVKHRERYFVASKMPRHGQDVWREFRNSIDQCLVLVNEMEA